MKNKNPWRGFAQEVINTVNQNKVILNLIQDLQRLLCLLCNSMRGRFQIKFAMTALLHNDNGECVEDAEQRHLSIRLFNKKAFTLIELLVVVLIIGILAAVALPQYQKAVKKARLTSALVTVDALKKALSLYVLENGYSIQTFTGATPTDTLHGPAVLSDLDCSAADTCTDGYWQYRAVLDDPYYAIWFGLSGKGVTENGAYMEIHSDQSYQLCFVLEDSETAQMCQLLDSLQPGQWTIE